jgi:hypothetical protein
MDQQPSKPKRRSTPASWKPGQTGNPGGRPRTGHAFADRVRERVDPDVVIDLALRLAADETVALDKRLTALLPLVHAGFFKPPAEHRVAMSAVLAPAALAVDELPLDVQRELLDSFTRARAALPAADDDPGE